MLNTIIYIVDIILTIGIVIMGCYLLVFTFSSLTGNKMQPPTSNKKSHIALLLPHGSIITEQTYSKDYHDTFYYDNLVEAIKNINQEAYDIVVVLGQTDRFSATLLQQVNNCFCHGIPVMQLHHITTDLKKRKNRRRAEDEEIKNALLRWGHNRLNLTASLGKIDFAMETTLLKNNLVSDKANLDNRMLCQEQFVAYLPDAKVYSASPRPIAKRFSRVKSIKLFPTTFAQGNFAYCEKLLRGFFPGWRTTFYIYLAWGIIYTGYDIIGSFKWWFILFVGLLCISLITPDYLVRDKKSILSIRKTNKQTHEYQRP